MKNGRHANKTGSKIFAVAVAVALVLCMVVGGTLAWLTDKTDPVVNTFSPSTIGVRLDEDKPVDQTAKMVPGWSIEKDPKAWITTGSEDAYLFVKIDKLNNFDDYMTFDVADGWELVPDTTNVYYRKVTSTQMGENNAFPILDGNKVVVNDDVTKADMEALTSTANYPKLSFTAYAVQLMKNSTEELDVKTAWQQAAALENGGATEA